MRCCHLRCEHRVQNHTCVPCDRGEYNPENHDASGPDTTCDIIQCAENEYVSNHMCQARPAGTYEFSADDPASGPDTVCDETTL